MRFPSVFYKVDVVLHASIRVLSERGEFISATKAKESGKKSTSEYVLELLRSVEDSEKIKNPLNELKVQEIIEHFKKLVSPVPDDFLTKVQNFLSLGVVSDRMIGFIVALPDLFDRKVKRTRTLSKIADKYANSNYMGEIGKRDLFFVKLLETKTIMKDEISLILYKVVDQLGNYGFFFSKIGVLSNEKGESIIGLYDCFDMKATPKKHEVGRSGIKETQFSRVRIVENYGKGSEE